MIKQTLIFEIQGDDSDIFIVVDGVKIARRGHKGTAEAMTWVSLEPGWTVIGSQDHEGIEISFEGARAH
jgi:hypothetical protein